MKGNEAKKVVSAGIECFEMGDKLANRINALIALGRYHTKSEAFRDLIRRGCDEVEAEVGVT